MLSAGSQRWELDAGSQTWELSCRVTGVDLGAFCRGVANSLWYLNVGCCCACRDCLERAGKCGPGFADLLQQWCCCIPPFFGPNASFPTQYARRPRAMLVPMYVGDWGRVLLSIARASQWPRRLLQLDRGWKLKTMFRARAWCNGCCGGTYLVHRAGQVV